MSARHDTTLVVPPALLAGCGPDYPPGPAFAALGRLGFAGVKTAAPFEEALRAATLGVANENGGRGVADGEVSAPVIVPVCPAVTNLIELRFPSLVGLLAPFSSPWETVEASGGGRPLACVISCPSQRSVLAQVETPAATCDTTLVECLLPEAVRQSLMRELTGAGAGGTASSAEGQAGHALPGAAPAADAGPRHDDGLLVVSGIRHVMAVLEELENGLLEDVTALEAYACEGGCFGSPLLSEDHHVAHRRWGRGRTAVEAAEAVGGAAKHPTAVSRRRPYAARPGIRLDPDMGRAIQKLGRLQALTRSLPGRDCGVCGAPTCAALAEDVVMERSGIELCPYTACEKEDTDS